LKTKTIFSSYKHLIVKMASNTYYKPRYAPNYGGWREREAMKEKQRKELEARKAEEARLAKAKMNETNFPVLVQGAAGNRAVQIGDQTFADMAEQWKFKDEVTQMREDARKVRDEKERISLSGVYLRRGNTYDELYGNGPSKYDRYMPPEQPKTNPAFDGWHLVDTKKTKKEKKELTEAELDAKYTQSASDDEDDAVDMNGHLFETNRHDHY
jgi:hypothetical protein